MGRASPARGAPSLARGDVATSDARSGNYTARLPIRVGGAGGPVLSIPRGWTSVVADVDATRPLLYGTVLVLLLLTFALNLAAILLRARLRARLAGR